MANYKTNLATSSNETFSSMMTGGFGIVTVMNVDVYDALDVDAYKALTPQMIVKGVDATGKLSVSAGSKSIVKERRCRIDTLKVANVNQEGPTKTVTGGQYTNPLIKFGKTARLEMQDALGRIDAIEALGGGVGEWDEVTTGTAGNTTTTKVYTAMHIGSEFAGPKLLIGDSFFIDRATGNQVKVKIVFYQFSPDSIFNLTQDAEGDATVFDLNGDLLTTDILIADKDGGSTTRGMFYSVVAEDQTGYEEPKEPTV